MITPEIRELMHKRDRLQKRAHQTFNSDNWKCYRSLRREVNLRIKLPEIQLVKDEISENKGNKTSI